MTPIPSTNNTGPLLQGTAEATTQSPGTPSQLFAKGLLWFTGNVSIPAALGMSIVVVNDTIHSKMNQTVDDYLYHHCFDNMTSAERDEYRELIPYYSPELAQAAITATTYLIYSGGLRRLYDAGKSLYDRACSYYAAPTPIENQTEEV